MKRILLAAVMVALGGDIVYGQTCQAYVNGAKARISKDKWEDARKVLAENYAGCTDEAEYNYLYAVSLARVSPDSTTRALDHLAKADSLNGEPGAEDELQANIDQAMAAMWGPMVNDGVRLLSAGQVEEAEAKLTMAVEINPAAKEGHLGLGAVYQAQNKYDQAIAEYERALEIDPQYKNALVRLGQAYQLKAEEVAAAGNTQQAEQIAAKAAEMYQNYLTVNPDDFEIQTQLANLYAALGQMEKAQPLIRLVMESDSVDADVLTDFGFRMAQSNQYELADEILTRAVQLTDSLNSESLSYLAFVRIQREDLPGAKAILERQLVLEPDNPEAWEYLGFVRRDLGDTAGAQEAFEKAEGIPLELEGLRMSQKGDQSWSIEATFSNRTEQPVQNVQVKFTLVDPTGNVLETQEAALAGEALSAGEAEKVTVEFTTPAENPRVRYDIL